MEASGSNNIIDNVRLPLIVFVNVALAMFLCLL